MEGLIKSDLEFLKTLKKNNNRDWFNDHKEEYLTHYSNVVRFADNLLVEMNKHDNIETSTGKKSLFRIYRDTRFSKDKTPYKTQWSGSLKRATKLLRGSYYFHIEPGNSFIGGGFWGPNPPDLLRIREEIASNDNELRTIITSKYFTDTFGSLKGECVKTAPKGFQKDHPSIDLLRHKQFIISKSFSDKEVLSPSFLNDVIDTFKKMQPFFNYMSEVLTTDANGVSLY